MLNFLVSRRPCGCVSAAVSLNAKPSDEWIVAGWSGKLVVDAMRRGEAITHEHEVPEFAVCAQCRTGGPQQWN